VLVIDDLHIIEHFVVHTSRVVREFLLSLPAQDRVAVVFVGRSDLSEDFTADPARLVHVADRIRDALGFAPDAADAPPSTWRDRTRWAGATADVLKNVANALTGSSYSRRAIVYVGEGMTYRRSAAPAGPMSRPSEAIATLDVFDQIESAFDRLRKAGVPVYTLDPRGIPGCDAVRGPCGPPPWVNIHAQQQMLREFAENTGGRAFVNQPDAVAAMREIVADNSHFYLVGYYPSSVRRDGGFQNVTVRVNRPGVEVRARAGYTATPPERGTPSSVEMLGSLLASAVPATGLGVRALAASTPVGTGVGTLITIEVSYPSVANRSTLRDEIEFGVAAIDREGRVLRETRRVYRFSGTSSATGAVSFLINEVLQLPARPLTLRLAVVSRTLGHRGAVHVPMDLSDRSGSRPEMRAILLGRAGRQPPALGSVPTGTTPFQPLIDHAFAPADTLRVHAPVFWRRDEDAPGGATIEIRRAAAIVIETAAALERAALAGGERLAATISAGIPLGDLLPGDYVLVVRTRLRSGAVIARSLPFTVAASGTSDLSVPRAAALPAR